MLKRLKVCLCKAHIQYSVHIKFYKLLPIRLIYIVSPPIAYINCVILHEVGREAWYKNAEVGTR